MGYTVLAFSDNGFVEYPLPDLDNSNYEIIIQQNVFQINKSIHIPMEVVDGIWSFVEKRDFLLKLVNTDEKGFGVGLKNGQVFQLTQNSFKMNFVISEKTSNFPIFDKYTLRYMKQINIGKLSNNTITYDFMSFISKTHAIIYNYEGRWLVRDESTNGTFLNGRRIQGQEYLRFGDTVTIFGLKIIFLDEYIAVAAISGEYTNNDLNLQQVHPRDNLEIDRENVVKEEKFYFKRAPRTIEKVYSEEIEIESPPPLNESKKRPLFLTIGPSFTMAIPMTMGVLMSIIAAQSRGQQGGAFMFTGLVTAVSSASIGVLWALINLKHTKKEEQENEEQRFNAYSQYLIDITNTIKEKYEYNQRVMKSIYHSGVECCQVNCNDVSLWNRNVRQPDFLTIRVGVGTMLFQAPIRAAKAKFTIKHDELAEKPAAIKEAYSKLYKVPACMDLLSAKVVGIIGGPQKAGAYPVAYNIIAQLAANNCYTDLKMVFIYKHSDLENKWSFARWLPHVWMEDKKTRLIADNKEELGDILFELSNVLRRRVEEQNSNRGDIPLPHFCIFVDEPELLEGEILEKTLYNPVPQYGITTFLLTEKYDELPNSCEDIIQNDRNAVKMFNIYDEEKYSSDLEVETVAERDLENLARRLCNIEVNETVESGEIPDSLDFFEMFGVHGLDELRVLDRWRKNRNYETMRVPIGMKNGGNICYLDVHEKYHGPHGLVAGTTGSGKSETLQTYILSLAVNFSPDDIAFFIIDFKGGGMANLFTNLPHMAGQISNLSGNQVRRAMISIKSENKRRQRIFAENNVNNINLYTRLYKNHETTLPVPHLFIIIDEFAELKREEPEFMKELISVAQVGRSLGVHLILATQKPSGTVDENIWSNSKFRLCLRVQDKQDSNDMLHRPDAAYITQAGRGYLQVGNDEIFEQFQSGYSGAEYIEDTAMTSSSVAELIKLNGKVTVSGGSIRRHKISEEKSITQLDAVINYLGKLAKQGHYDRKMMLWKPILPEQIYLADLNGYEAGLYSNDSWLERSGEFELKVPIGMYDDPANQDQKTLYVDFKDGGNLAVCGLIGTGKSTFLQTMLWSLIQHYSPEDMNFYVLDYSSRMLLPYENAPHCGGVIIDTDEDKVNKFFFMVNKIMEDRKTLFKGVNYNQYVRANRGKKKLPAILIVIDNCANFREKTNKLYDDELIRLSREGMGYGIYLVITGAGYGSNEIPTRLADNMKTIISLEMGDKFKYTEIFHTAASSIQILPEANVKGRGLTSVMGQLLEFQTALVCEAEDAYEQSARIESACKEMSKRYQGAKARRIPVIPEKPTFGDMLGADDYKETLAEERYLPYAYMAKDASIYSIDLWNAYCYLIQGKAKTGKTNVMQLLLYAAMQKENAKVYVLDDEVASMRGRAEELGATLYTDPKEIFEFFNTTIPIVKKRSELKKEYATKGMENLEISQKMADEGQIFIFISNLVEFVKMASKPVEGKGSIQKYLENITEKGSGLGIYFICCVNLDDTTTISGNRIYQNIISYKNGVHLGGNVSGQRVFQFTNIPYQEGMKATKAGLGLVSSVDDYTKAENIVIPFLKGSYK